MARRTAEELAGVTVGLVYIAAHVAEAEKAERLLDELAVDYLLRLEPFTTTSVFGGEYMGLFIYVPAGEHARCRRALAAIGLTDTVALEVSELVERLYGA